jgi:putative transposase
MDIRKQGHCAYTCKYHIVIVAKYRRKIFKVGSFECFCEGMKGVLFDGMPEVEILEPYHDVDHIHLLLSISAKMRGVSDVVRRIKSTTGRLLKRTFDDIQETYWGLWYVVG